MKTLAEIAREMGVSAATVSYVFNDKWRENRITPELAKRIKDRIAEEKASPNLLARQLSTGKTCLIGVMLADLVMPYYLNLLSGIEEVLGNMNYLTLLGTTQHGKHEVNNLVNMVHRGVDGIIFCPMTATPPPELLSADVPPTVLVDNYYSAHESAFSAYTSDNFLGAKTLVEEAVKQGRKRFVYVGAEQHLPTLADRYRGYQEALETAGLADKSALEDTDLDKLKKVLSLPAEKRPDAIMVGSLFYFSEGFQLLSEMGIQPGRDITVMGFDTPPVGTGVEGLLMAIQQAETMGHKAAEQLLAQIQQKDNASKRRKTAKAQTQENKISFLKPQVLWNGKPLSY